MTKNLQLFEDKDFLLRLLIRKSVLISQTNLKQIRRRAVCLSITNLITQREVKIWDFNKLKRFNLQQNWLKTMLLEEVLILILRLAFKVRLPQAPKCLFKRVFAVRQDMQSLISKLTSKCWARRQKTRRLIWGRSKVVLSKLEAHARRVSMIKTVAMLLLKSSEFKVCKRIQTMLRSDVTNWQRFTRLVGDQRVRNELKRRIIYFVTDLS